MKFKNIVLGIGIFIVFLLMLGYGIEAFHPSPKYENYCNYSAYYPEKYPTTVDVNCTFSPALQDKVNACSSTRGMPVYEYNNNGCAVGLKECNMCQIQYEDAQKADSKVIFLVSLIVGLIALFVGYGILSVEPVGSALMASGIGSIVYGSIRNWQNLSDVWRFLLLVIALILLIWIALRINRNVSVSNKKRK